jgi:proline iminopeptidase, Neisseria-type subfamily
MARYERYPEIEPLAIRHLQVSPLHNLYIEEVGNPNGLPVIYLHGGPGVGTLPHYRRFFDPALFHVILFSQRGCLPSSPAGELAENDTQHLVEDIEAIRKLFGIERWIVFGGSWGSTLALAYAIRHTEHVSGLVLRGIFLGRQRELDWMYREGGAGRIFPETWQKFNEFIPAVERGDLVLAYQKRLLDPDPQVHFAAAHAWNDWEGSIISLLPGESEPMPDFVSLAMAKIENHYMVQHLFFERDNYLLEEAHKLREIPCHIVQGRYDMICPAESALALAHELPQANLHIVPDAGHSGSEPGNTSELIAAMLDLHRVLTA